MNRSRQRLKNIWVHCTSRWVIALPLLALLVSGSLNAQADSDLEEPIKNVFSNTERTYDMIPIEQEEGGVLVALTVYRVGDTSDATQSFRIEVAEQPGFLEPISISDPELSFTRDEWEKPVQIQLTPGKDAESGEGEVRLLITAEDVEIVPQQRTWILPVKFEAKPSDASEQATEEPGDLAFVIRTLKRGYELGYLDARKDVIAIHDEDLPLFTVDPVYICFPEANAKANFGFYRIYDPEGEVFQEGGYSSTISGLTNDARVDVEGAPYRVIIELKGRYPRGEGAKDASDDKRRLPGTYRLEVARSRFIASEYDLLGVPTQSEPDEWIEAGTFEILPVEFEFKGVATLIFENESSPDPNLFLEASPQTSGGSGGSIQLNFNWTEPDETTVGEGKTSIQYAFPDSINYDELNPSEVYTSRLSPAETEEWKAGFQNTFPLSVNKAPGAYHQLKDDSPSASMKSLPSIPMMKPQGGVQTGLRSEITLERYYTTSAGISIFANLEGDWEDPATLGWYLREPDTRYGISLWVNVNAGNRYIGRAMVVGLYGSKDASVGEIELKERSRAMEKPNFTSQPGERDGTSEDDQSDEGSSGADASGSQTDASTPSSSQSGTSEGSESSSGNETAGESQSPLDPNTLDPNRPDISGHIQTWIRIAEPVQNATEGASLKYNRWGVVHGKTRTGIITETPGKPDEVGPLNSSEYLWSVRHRLDSVDHCTLQEYVMTMLSGGSVAHCAGRYERKQWFAVPAVVGQSMNAAESILQSKGFSVLWKAGPPAPYKMFEGKIAEQFPVKNTELEIGADVTLTVYTEYVSDLKLPNVLGQSMTAAETTLNDLGLQIEWKAGDPAPSREFAGVVQSQSPQAEESYQEGQSVTLHVYTEFIEVRSMPAVAGFTMDKAEATLEKLGLNVVWEVGDPAQSSSQTATVQSQHPKSGATVVAGQTATLLVYSEYIAPPKVTVPTLSGMTMNQLANTLNLIGLKGRWKAGDAAPNASRSKTVYKQTPNAGAKVDPGSEVVVTMYAEYQAPVATPPPVVTPQPRVTDNGSGNSSTNPSRPSPSVAGGQKYLNPVQQITFRPEVKGYAQVFPQKTLTREEAKGWKSSKNTFRGMFAAYGTGDPMGNLADVFGEDDPNAQTHFLIMPVWLEKGDKWGTSVMERPNERAIIEPIQDQNIFLDDDNDAIAYKVSFGPDVPIFVIIYIKKTKQNTFSKQFCKTYARELAEQLLAGGYAGGADTNSTRNTGVTPSSVAQIRFPENTGSIAKIPISGSSRVLMKGNDQWWDPKTNTRVARFTYFKPGPAHYQPKLDVELMWLEKNDPFQSSHQQLFSEVTRYKAPPPGAFSRGIQVGPMVYQDYQRQLRVKLTSNNAFQFFSFYDLEDFVEQLLAELRPHAAPRQNRYSPMTNFRFPTRVQELVPGGSIQNFSTRQKMRKWIGTGFQDAARSYYWNGFCRKIHFHYFTGNLARPSGNTGNSSNEIFGIPSSGGGTPKNLNLNFNVYWLEWGDPATPGAKRAFKGRDVIEVDRKYINIGNVIYHFHSSRLAAKVEVTVDYDSGMTRNFEKRLQGAKPVVQDIFRQLEGHALRFEDIRE